MIGLLDSQCWLKTKLNLYTSYRTSSALFEIELYYKMGIYTAHHNT